LHGSGSLARTRLAAGLVALTTAGAYCLAWEAPRAAQIALAAFAAIVVFGRSAAAVSGWLAAALFGDVVLRSADSWVDPYWMPDDLARSLLLVAALAFALGHAELYRGPLRVRKKNVGVGSGVPGRVAEAEARIGRLNVASVLLGEGIGSIAAIAVAVLLAAVILSAVPVDALSRNDARIAPPVYRLAILVWGVAVAALIAESAGSMMRWRRMQPSQAVSFVGGVLFRGLRRETAVLLRVSRRRKRAARYQNRWANNKGGRP